LKRLVREVTRERLSWAICTTLAATPRISIVWFAELLASRALSINEEWLKRHVAYLEEPVYVVGRDHEAPSGRSEAVCKDVPTEKHSLQWEVDIHRSRILLHFEVTWRQPERLIVCWSVENERELRVKHLRWGEVPRPLVSYEPALTSLCAQGISYINENLNSSKVKVLNLRSVI
jgi:hypothetical protein